MKNGNPVVATGNQNGSDVDTIINEGYMVSANGNDWTSGTTKILTYTDRTYVTTRSYWLASPSAHGAWDLMVIGFTGWRSITSQKTHYEMCGFRPIVCLKADTELEKVEGGYRIIE